MFNEPLCVFGVHIIGMEAHTYCMALMRGRDYAKPGKCVSRENIYLGKDRMAFALNRFVLMLFSFLSFRSCWAFLSCCCCLMYYYYIHIECTFVEHLLWYVHARRTRNVCQFSLKFPEKKQPGLPDMRQHQHHEHIRVTTIRNVCYNIRETLKYTTEYWATTALTTREHTQTHSYNNNNRSALE